MRERLIFIFRIFSGRSSRSSVQHRGECVFRERGGLFDTSCAQRNLQRISTRKTIPDSIENADSSMLRAKEIGPWLAKTNDACQRESLLNGVPTPCIWIIRIGKELTRSVFLSWCRAWLCSWEWILLVFPRPCKERFSRNRDRNRNDCLRGISGIALRLVDSRIWILVLNDS